MAGVAIGLFLGAKPTALLGTALLLAALAFRARREGVLRVGAPPAVVLTTVLGAETYVVNLIRHANPIWPVRVDVGAVHLPGTHTMSELLASGANTPRTHGNPLQRVVESWTTVFPPLPVLDMRVGGLGWCSSSLCHSRSSAPCARSLTVALVAAASLAVPDPYPRFVLGFAGLVIALAVPCVEHVRKPAHWAVFGVVALAAVQSIAVAYPGLRGKDRRSPPTRAWT